MALIRFDELSTWEESLSRALGGHLSRRLDDLRRPHAFVEDARDALLAEDRLSVLTTTLSWLKANTLAGYHGTRLTSAELQSVRRSGLTTLTATERLARLRRALAQHADWPSVAERLAGVVEKAGRGIMFGCRTDQAHLTLSRSALSNGFNHYLTHGSEFDQCIAETLLGQEGLDLLAADGAAYVLEFAVPGPAALAAAHRFASPEELIDRGEVPNLANPFLKVLSYRISRPDFQPSDLGADCGLVFSEAVPPEWLCSATPWSETTD